MVGARDDNASIVLKAQDYIHLNTSSAIVSGARFAEDGFTPIKTGDDATLTIQTSGELKISGSVTAAGRMQIEFGSSQNGFAEYFDTLPGKDCIDCRCCQDRRHRCRAQQRRGQC